MAIQRLIGFGKKEEFKEILAILRKQNPDRIRVLWNLSCTEKKIIEPLTGIHIQPGQTAVIRVTGDAAFNQIKGNVDQLKALKDYDVLAMSFEVVDDEPVHPDP